MLKRICFFILFVYSFQSLGESSQVFEESSNNEEQKKSGYKYIIENYFSKQRHSSYSYSRSFTFYSGISFYREGTSKTFKPFSSFIVGFNQKVTDISYLGDLNLQWSVFSTRLERHRVFFLEVTPRISFPEVQAAFPLYIGLGAGVGFYPRYLVRKVASVSLNGQVFMGFRLLELYHNLGFSSEINLKMYHPFSETSNYLDVLCQMGLIFSF